MREINYDESRVPPYTLPDPLRDTDGKVLTDPAAWPGRRAEILALFADHVYGRAPATPPPSWDMLEEGVAVGGRALRRQVRLRVAAGGGAVDMDLLLLLPSVRRAPAPVFLGLNFHGNHTVTDDPAVRLPGSWVSGGDGRAREADRGRDAGAWALETLLARGYGLATLYCGDVEPDRAEPMGQGIRSLVPGGPAGAAHAWGALAAWAWGLRRAMDYLETDSDVDSRRVAVMGHSRLGKAALWAGAQDERFALVVSNNSGCGGAALSRRQLGESVARINASFPHWFCPAFHRYDDREWELPVDQHMLLALVAPRPLYVGSAVDDRWADPRGEFLSALAAAPVYRLLGTDGLAAAEMPGPQQPVGSTIGYHLRPGGHGVTAYDWERYLDAADRQMRRAGG